MRYQDSPEGDPRWSISRDLIRGAIRLHVLHHGVEREIHGAWLTEELARHGYRISPGTLYPMLHEMEQAGVLASARRTVGGKVRRVYRTTPSGCVALDEGRRVLQELATEVGVARTEGLAGTDDARDPAELRTDVDTH